MAAIDGRETDRLPVTEIGVWPETRLRWIGEGMPENVSCEDYFGLDKMLVFPHGGSLGLESKVLEDNEKYTVSSNANGCVSKRLKNSYGASLLIDSLVRDTDTWLKYRGGLTPNLESFERADHHFGFGYKLPHNMKEQYAYAKANDIFTVYSPQEPCWFYLGLVGEEEALCGLAGDPGFAEQVISDYTDFNLEMLKILSGAGYKFDALWMFSDLCYKNGMLFSPKFFRERAAKYVKKTFDTGRELGMKIIFHSDGYVGELIPLLIDVGVDCLQPLEVRAGNDAREYAKTYRGKLAYMGNINADALAAGREAIYGEISAKVPAMMETGRYIYHSDHSIPDTVSLADFKYALELARKYGGKR